MDDDDPEDHANAVQAGEQIDTAQAELTKVLTAAATMAAALDFAPDADDECCGPGYGYNCGWIKLNTTDQQELGRYMTLCPFDVWGDLDRCETALWENHASAEEMAVNR